MSEARDEGVVGSTRLADRDQSHGVEYLVAILGHGFPVGAQQPGCVNREAVETP